MRAFSVRSQKFWLAATLGCVVGFSTGCVELVDEGENLLNAITRQIEQLDSQADSNSADPNASSFDGEPNAWSDSGDVSRDSGGRSGGVSVPLSDMSQLDPYSVSSVFDPHYMPFNGFDASGLYADQSLYSDLSHSYRAVYGTDPNALLLENWYASYVYYMAAAYSSSGGAWDSSSGYYDGFSGSDTTFYDYPGWGYGYSDGYNSGYSNSLINSSVQSSGDSGYIYMDGDFVSW